MPPKSVKCSICGEEVSKRKTYLVDPETGARACKTHEGVEQKKNQIRGQEEARKRRQESEARDLLPRDEPLDLKPKCFACGKHGLVDVDWWERLIIARDKVRQVYGMHGFNLGSEAARLYGKRLRQAMIGPEGEDWHANKINRIPDDPDNPKMKKLFSAFNRDAKQAARFMGIFAVCDECMEKYGIEQRIEQPKVSLQHMLLLGNLLEPAIRDKARQEIRREAEKN